MNQNTQLPNPGTILAFGIVGLATSGSGILGLVFSILAVVNAGKFRSLSPEPSGQVNTGRGLGIAGIVLSSIMIVVWIIVIIVAIAAGTYYYSYY